MIGKQPKRRVPKPLRTTGMVYGGIVAGVQPVTYRTSITIEDFLAIEDEDLKKFIYADGLIQTKNYVKTVNNEEKIGYYYIGAEVRKNTQGAFYRHTFLHSWLVYNKKTKKVKIADKNQNVKAVFFRDYIKKEAMDIAMRFIRRLTPTLCKKIIEGKINTIGDLIAYNKSYVLRKKQLSLRTVYNFMINTREDKLSQIEDPEKLESLEQIEGIDSRVAVSGAFTYKLEDIDKIKERYDEWYRKQSKKYDSFSRQRDGKARNSAGQEPA